MAMVEVPGGSAVGGRSNLGRRTTPRKLEGRLEKDERMVSRSPQVARIQICKVNISRLLRDKLVYFINKIRGEVLCLLKTCVTIPFISLVLFHCSMCLLAPVLAPVPLEVPLILP